MIIEEKEPFFWRLSPDWLEDKSGQILELFEEKECPHKWEDIAVINFPPETSIICGKCGKNLLKDENL